MFPPWTLDRSPALQGDDSAEEEEEEASQEVVVGRCESMAPAVDPASIRENFERGFERHGLTWQDTTLKKHAR